MIGMLGRLRRRRSRPDPEAFLDDLRRAMAGRTYTRTDRSRDFRAVFLGASTPEQGRRVLWQILAWARMYRNVAARGDPYETYFRAGQRDLGLQILMTMNAEPAERPGDGADRPQRE